MPSAARLKQSYQMNETDLVACRIFVDYLNVISCVLVVCDIRPFSYAFFAGFASWLQAFANPLEMSMGWSCLREGQSGSWYAAYLVLAWTFLFMHFALVLWFLGDISGFFVHFGRPLGLVCYCGCYSSLADRSFSEINTENS